MMIVEQVWISDQYITAILYGDESGLEEDESLMLDDFMEHIAKNDYLVMNGEELEWKKCELSNSYSDCYLINVVRD
jgi:hypothetical protein